MLGLNVAHIQGRFAQSCVLKGRNTGGCYRKTRDDEGEKLGPQGTITGQSGSCTKANKGTSRSMHRYFGTATR